MSGPRASSAASALATVRAGGAAMSREACPLTMILHNNPTALIMQGNTLADPKFTDGDTLKTFDYVVANPPFSDKRWSTGLDPLLDRLQLAARLMQVNGPGQSQRQAMEVRHTLG